REVAALRVLLRAAPVDRGRPATVDVGVVGAEGRDLELVVVFEDEHHAERGTHADGAAKQLPDGLGRRGRRDVVVARLAAEQTVTHAAAGQVRLESGGPEPPDDVSRELPLR